MNTQTTISSADIKDKEHELEQLKGRYLRSRGWAYSSSHTPGCYWVWRREWDGHPLMANLDFAVTLQTRIDESEAEKG